MDDPVNSHLAGFANAFRTFSKVLTLINCVCTFAMMIDNPPSTNSTVYGKLLDVIKDITHSKTEPIYHRARLNHRRAEPIHRRAGLNPRRAELTHSIQLGILLLLTIHKTGNTVVVMQPRRTVSVTSTVDAPVDDYGYTVSIVLCFICLFCGSWCSLCCIVPAIYFASSAKSAASRGHLESARHSGRIANGLNTASVVSYVIIFAVSIGLSLDAHTVIVTKHEMSGEECSACPFQPTVTILPV
eukprot:Em0069g7a